MSTKQIDPIKRIQNEIRRLHRDPIPGIRIKPEEDNIKSWDVYVDGPPGSLYAVRACSSHLSY